MSILVTCTISYKVAHFCTCTHDQRLGPEALALLEFQAAVSHLMWLLET